MDNLQRQQWKGRGKIKLKKTTRTTKERNWILNKIKTKQNTTMWRKALLLKYIGLPIPPSVFLYTFNFSQTVGEMVFVSFEVEKMRMFLVQSIVRN